MGGPGGDVAGGGNKSVETSLDAADTSVRATYGAVIS